MHSQMEADWTPDDLLWYGSMVCFGAKRQDGGGGVWGLAGECDPDALLKLCPAVLVGRHNAGQLSNVRTVNRKSTDMAPFILYRCPG